MVPSDWASGDSLNFKNAKGKQSVPGGIGLHRAQTLSKYYRSLVSLSMNN